MHTLTMTSEKHKASGCVGEYAVTCSFRTVKSSKVSDSGRIFELPGRVCFSY